MNIETTTDVSCRFKLDSLTLQFYMLEEIQAYLHLHSDKQYMRSFQAFTESFTTMREKYNAAIARAFRDYLAIACMGEMRHATRCIEGYSGRLSVFDGSAKKEKEIGFQAESSRLEIYVLSSRVSPEESLSQSKEVFSHSGWHGSMGGRKWAAIAGWAMKYGRISDVEFVDHIYDLHHNCGNVLNKNCFWVPGSMDASMNILNHKRDTRAVDVARRIPILCDGEVWDLFDRAVSLEIVKPIPRKASPGIVRAEKDISIPAFDWKNDGGILLELTDTPIVTKQSKPYWHKVDIHYNDDHTIDEYCDVNSSIGWGGTFGQGTKATVYCGDNPHAKVTLEFVFCVASIHTHEAEFYGPEKQQEVEIKEVYVIGKVPGREASVKAPRKTRRPRVASKAAAS